MGGIWRNRWFNYLLYIYIKDLWICIYRLYFGEKTSHLNLNTWCCSLEITGKRVKTNQWINIEEGEEIQFFFLGNFLLSIPVYPNFYRTTRLIYRFIRQVFSIIKNGLFGFSVLFRVTFFFLKKGNLGGGNKWTRDLIEWHLRSKSWLSFVFILFTWFMLR